MRTSDVLRFALTQLLRNKGRASLTATGVAVGVFAFTTIVAIGNGLEVAVTDQLTDDESPTRIVVRPGFGTMPEVDAVVEGVDDPEKAARLRKAIAKRRRGGPGQLRRTLLTTDAIASLATRAHVVAARPLVIDRFVLTHGERVEDGAMAYGVRPDDPRWQDRVIAGASFSAEARGVWLHEYLLYTWGFRSDAEQAALVGREVTLARPRGGAGGMAAMLDAAQRSGIDLPVDPRLLEPLLMRAGGGGAGGTPPPALTLPILGVVRERVESDRFEVWEDSFSMQADLFLPQPLGEALFLQDASNLARGYTAAALEVDDAANVKEVEAALRKDGWGTASVASILQQVSRALAIITVFVSGLTAIAVLVAVIGIVNTMIMNVSERTREIGTLKALGATDGQVRGMFVAESALLGLFGGAVGIVCALVGSYPGDLLAQGAILRMTEYAYPGSIFSFPVWLILAALGFALVLSVLAALGPAHTASRVDPVIALRDE